ncbi:MAG: DUF934 domain-containing protein [Rhizobiaceae bacterium]
MTEHNETRLWTPTDGFRDNDWQRVEELPAQAGESRYLLPLGAFLALGDNSRAQYAGRLGVEIAPGEALDAVLPFLDDIALISLAFPAFGDGRSYSKAELLRTRHGYKGPLRAAGDVLIDQVPHMIRTGFSELEIANPTTLKRLENGETGGIEHHYQPTAKQAAKAGGYAWRRRASA